MGTRGVENPQGKTIIHAVLCCCGGLRSFAVNVCGSGHTNDHASKPRRQQCDWRRRKRVSFLSGQDIVNDLLERQWHHISSWFETKMKTAVEPLLKKNLSDTLSLAVCNLGTRPARLDGLVTQLRVEKDDFESIVLSGFLDYSGDAQVKVEVRAGGKVEVAKVTVTDVTIKGNLVIELVGLTDTPPWFSGLRAYFPNAPQINADVQMDVFLLDHFYDTAAVARSRILQSVRSVIGNAVVLPNCYVIDLHKGLDFFHLRHPLPQGVLRMGLVKQPRARGSNFERLAASSSNFGTLTDKIRSHRPLGNVQEPAEQEVRVEGEDAKDSSHRSWKYWLKEGSGTSVTRAEITVGNSTHTMQPGDVVEFLIHDWERQEVNIVLRDTSKLSANQFVNDIFARRLVATQGFNARGEMKPANYDLVGNGQVGTYSIQAQWRPCAPPGTLGKPLEYGRFSTFEWGLGDTWTSSWMLHADLYYVLGLPASDPNSGDWISLEIRHRSHPEKPPVVAAVNSDVVRSVCPCTRALDLLANCTASAGFHGDLPDDVVRALQEHVPVNVWRRALGMDLDLPQARGSSAQALLGSFDAVWMYPFRFLLGTSEPLTEQIRSLEILVVVKRRDGNQREEILGQGSHHLQNIADSLEIARGGCVNVGVPLDFQVGPSYFHGAVKLRLQIMPLLQAPHFRHDDQMGTPILPQFETIRGLTRRISGFFLRGNTGEFNHGSSIGENPRDFLTKWQPRHGIKQFMSNKVAGKSSQAMSPHRGFQSGRVDGSLGSRSRPDGQPLSIPLQNDLAEAEARHI